MASTDKIPAANREILIGDVESNRPNSESVNRKLGGSLNFILERLYLDMKFNCPGYFNPNAFDDGYAGIEVIESDCIVSRYILSLHKSGGSGTSSFNVAVYDSSGAFVNNLFGSGGNALSISGNSGTNVIIGKKGVDTVTPTNISVNTAGHTVFLGNLNLGTQANPLLAGYVLVPYIVSNGDKAYNMNFSLRCKEL
jgi:hypothetical protein